MKIKDLKELLEKIPEQTELVISEAFILDKDGEIQGIVDCPVNGMAYDQETKEFRFLLNKTDVKSCFPKMEIIDLSF